MIRTVISLDEDDKRWLDSTAADEGVPMTELIRRAVRLLRSRASSRRLPFDELLGATSGLWKKGDGLDYQERMRDEW